MALNEQEIKHKHSIEVLEKHFENILNNELKKLRGAGDTLDKSEKLSDNVSIHLRFFYL